jgi:septal ring factor EnvC (AmiA/AmiB activator)
MTTSRKVLVLLSFIFLAAFVTAQNRDPLSDAESDQLREMAQEPLKRFKLLLKFATERLNTVDLARQDPKMAHRGQKIHDALSDFRQIVDELDDNIDDYSDKHADLRRPLKEVVDAETSFQNRLGTIKQSASDPQNAAEYQLYSFALQDALESVNLSLDDAKKTLDEQSEAFKEQKKKK